MVIKPTLYATSPTPDRVARDLNLQSTEAFCLEKNRKSKWVMNGGKIRHIRVVKTQTAMWTLNKSTAVWKYTHERGRAEWAIHAT